RSMALRAPALDPRGLHAPVQAESPMVVEAEAAGFKAEHRGGGGDALGPDRQFQALQPFNVLSVPEEDGMSQALVSVLIHARCRRPRKPPSGGRNRQAACRAPA